LKGRITHLASAAAAMLSLLVLAAGCGGSPAPKTTQAPAISISAAKLVDYATLSATPIYWLGPKQGDTLELTKTSDGEVYIRYLPTGVAVGSSKPYLTIGSYPLTNAYSVTRKAAAAAGAVAVKIGSGGIGFYSQKDPTSVYFAYPGIDVQVEVYDPAAGEASALVSSGDVKEIVAKPTVVAPRGVTATGLDVLAKSSQTPVYWAGPAKHVTYEFSRTSTGETYVRYLTRGARVGTKTPYETIGTYPLASAFSVTEVLARKKGSVSVPVGGQGVAFYYASRPQSIYVAYPGATVQIEVYDPSPAVARKLVTGGSLQQLR
jgi:hypothetical protein